MKTLSLFLALYVTAFASAMGQRKETERFIFLDPADTLQIEFSYSAEPDLLSRAPSMANQIEDRRYRDFQTAIASVLPIVDLPMNYRVLQQNERAEQGHPLLRINAMRWRLNDFGEVEAVIRVTLDSYGERNILGSFSNEEHVAGLPSSDLMDRLYVQTMVQSLLEMSNELMTHFEMPPVPEEQPGQP